MKGAFEDIAALKRAIRAGIESAPTNEEESVSATKHQRNTWRVMVQDEDNSKPILYWYRTAQIARDAFHGFTLDDPFYAEISSPRGWHVADYRRAPAIYDDREK